ncbi:hypothetical protein Taro_017580 [Colocasia esculenta]|uniref:Uncharacterized protein n=1 Tax=Colocasia esculenta TaxID=4460 RepID=A0A843URQ6_COLES|nr:hypothetical protein [Colocasia esculenta]
MHSWQPKFVPSHPLGLLDGQGTPMEEEILKLEKVKFTTCWGRVEELLVAGELWIDHKKAIFFPYSSATTSANHPLGVEQRCFAKVALVKDFLCSCRFIAHLKAI